MTVNRLFIEIPFQFYAWLSFFQPRKCHSWLTWYPNLCYTIDLMKFLILYDYDIKIWGDTYAHVPYDIDFFLVQSICYALEASQSGCARLQPPPPALEVFIYSLEVNLCTFLFSIYVISSVDLADDYITWFNYLRMKLIKKLLVHIQFIFHGSQFNRKPLFPLF